MARGGDSESVEDSMDGEPLDQATPDAERRNARQDDDSRDGEAERREQQAKERSE